MKLFIKNFAKIRNADIDIKGITVIAGENNTGKSTVGEVLSSFFNSLCDLDKNIENYKFYSLRHIFSNVLFDFKKKPAVTARIRSMEFQKQIERLLENSRIKTDDSYLDVEISGIMEYLQISDYDILKIKESVKKLLTITDKEILTEDVSNYFNSVFNSQINSMYIPEPAELKIVIKDKECSVSFIQNDITDISIGYVITKSATYINDPFILNRLNQTGYYYESNNMTLLENDLLKKLSGIGNSTEEANTIDQIIASDTLKEVVNELNCVIPGSIVHKDKFLYRQTNGKEIDVISLSTGLKSFAILKHLIENSKLNEKDVLVLDEPEIHLHPEWQLIYAEIIVLLQKALNLNIIITTHSSTFLEAIDLYSRKHYISERCTYYLSKESDIENMSDFEDITANLDKAYKQLVSPTLLLSQLRESLELKNDD